MCGQPRDMDRELGTRSELWHADLHSPTREAESFLTVNSDRREHCHVDEVVGSQVGETVQGPIREEQMALLNFVAPAMLSQTLRLTSNQASMLRHLKQLACRDPEM